MAITTTTSRVQYTGNNSSTVFAINFKFIENSHIVAELDDTAGTVTTLVLDTNYTLSGAGNDSGGTFTASVAPPTGHILTIYRQVPLTQTSDLVLTGTFNSQTVEDMIDKNTQMIQQLDVGISATSGSLVLKYPLSEPATTLSEIPSNANRSNKVLAFDSTGNPIATDISASGTGDVIGPASNTLNNVPQWTAATKTLSDGLGVLKSTDTTVDNDSNLATVGHILNQIKSLALPETTTQTLTEGATVAWDRNAGHNATISIAGTVSLGISNLSAGSYNLHVKKTNASALLNFTSNFKWADGIKPSLANVSLNNSAIFSFMNPGNGNLYGAAISNVK
jgi:hypothetical protein